MEVVHEYLGKAEGKANLQVTNMKNKLEAVREESRILGFFDKIRYDNNHNEFLKYAALYQIKQKKEYCKEGLTWKAFCDEIGEPRKTVDKKIQEIRPVVEKFVADLATFSGVPFSKIRYLGRFMAGKVADSATFDNNNLLIDGVKIPLSPDNKDEIESAIDALKDTHTKEKETLSKKVEKLEKQKDQLVDEETKGLKVERDALIKENVRLKEFEPAQEWGVKDLENIADLAGKLDSAIRRLSVKMPENIKNDPHEQAVIKMIMVKIHKRLTMLRSDWEDEFDFFDNEVWEGDEIAHTVMTKGGYLK
jgi:hypothetical protein